MTRSLSQTITALADSEIAVEVTSAPRQEVTVAVGDLANGVEETKSFAPGQLEKAASWLHGTAVRACPDSRYAREAQAASPSQRAGEGGPSIDMMESLRQGLTGAG